MAITNNLGFAGVDFSQPAAISHKFHRVGRDSFPGGSAFILDCPKQ
jgi:hypothetical protein